MGSSESMVGSIVWVRRRNGSWWPGKILGPNDLSASHLTSPRSGTPVKLLGREDASVDWYNLEKSKRVKAFRCGEFDDCIERAEASLGLPVKKREKYARREDAILHALELEKKHLVKKHGKLSLTNFRRENSSDSGRRVFATSSLALENGNGKPQSLHEHKPEDRTYHNLRGNKTEESHQMKGLQDFGLRSIPLNRMIHTSAGFDDSNRMKVEGNSCGVPTQDPCFESSGDSDPWNVEVSLPRQADYSLQHDFDFISMYEKREGGESGCQFGYFPEASMVFDSHNAPQDQVEIPSSRLDATNCHRGTFAEETASGSSEQTESDSSESTHFLESRVEAGIMLSDVETHKKAQARTTDSSGMREGGELTRNDVTHQVSVHDMSQFYLPEPSSSGFGVTQWLSKRKRNARNFSKRPMGKFTRKTYIEERDRSINDDNDYSENDVDFIVGDFEPSTSGFVKSGFFPSQTAGKNPNFARQNILDWEELAWGRPSRDKCFNPTFVGRNAEDMLIDVDLKVQANYQGENVPWVSLTSRLNGKAIIGHPVQIEALEDGSTYILVSSRYPIQGTKKKTKTESLSSFGFDHKSRKRRREKNPKYLMDEAIKSVDSTPPVVACVPVKLVFSRLLEATRGVSTSSRNRSLGTL